MLLKSGSSGEVVGEVPATKVAGFQADQQGVTGAVGVGGSGLRAEVERGDAPYRIADSRGGEPDVAAHLNSTVGRDVLAHHDAGSRISRQLYRLHVIAAGHHLEAAVVPFVPHRRQQNCAIAPVSCQYRKQRKFHEVVEIIDGQVPAHEGTLRHAWAWNLRP